MDLLFALLVDVQLLKSYIVPTGSMAPTILGYHKSVNCPSCGSTLLVNASREAEPGARVLIASCTCPQCWQRVKLQNAPTAPRLAGGDRIIVVLGHKGSYGRFDLTVYKQPTRYFRDKEDVRYLGRILGLPGETLAIHQGDLYRSTALKFDDGDVPADVRWQLDHAHEDDPRTQRAYDTGQFSIIRKSPAMMVACRRLVHDQDFPAKDQPSRWATGGQSNWQRDGKAFRSESTAELDWLRYRHLRPQDRDQLKPTLVTDFFSYNAFEASDNNAVTDLTPPENWVGDLMLECEAEIREARGELWLELNRGTDRFRMRWDLAKAEYTLFRGGDGAPVELGRKPVAGKAAGKHRLRFANFDRRLTVWIGDDLPFGAGLDYAPAKPSGPTRHDLEPVGIGSKGAPVALRHLQVWRDTYYSVRAGSADHGFADINWSNPETWTDLTESPRRFLHIQPGHYFLLGDNPMASSDSRDWGVVPESLLQGSVTLRYFPLDRMGWMR